jgi:hypothetical protein
VTARPDGARRAGGHPPRRHGACRGPRIPPAYVFQEDEAPLFQMPLHPFTIHAHVGARTGSELSARHCRVIQRRRATLGLPLLESASSISGSEESWFEPRRGNSVCHGPCVVSRRRVFTSGPRHHRICRVPQRASHCGKAVVIAGTYVISSTPIRNTISIGSVAQNTFEIGCLNLSDAIKRFCPTGGCR